MRYLKTLGLLAGAIAALMAFAAGAPATTITSPTGTVATPTIKAETEGGHLKLANPLTTIECASTFEAKVESHGASVPANLTLTSLEFSGCTGQWHTTTSSPGSLIVHWTGGYNGIVTSTGAKFDATRLGIACVYETRNTQIGTLTGGTPATLHLEASIPLNEAESSKFCGTGTAKWEGSYKLSSPETLFVDEGTPPPPGTAITSPTGTVSTPTIKAETEGGHFTLANPVANINCASSFEGKIESHGVEAAAIAKLSSLAFTGCTNNWHVTTVAPGELAIEWTSGYNGTVISTGMTINATRLGLTCNYATSGTQIGTITGGTPATLHLEAALSIHSGSSKLCGTGTAKWVGSYKLSSPEGLFVDEG